jgi:hypothetical protein
MENRYASMKEFASALTDFLAEPRPRSGDRPRARDSKEKGSLTATAPLAALPRLQRSAVPRWSWLIAASVASAMLLVGLTIVLMTPRGEQVSIELSDPDAKVEITVDGTIKVTDRDRTFTVSPGEHELKVSGPEYETVTRQFTVKRGRQETVRVTLLPKRGPGSIRAGAVPAEDGGPAEDFVPLFNGRDLSGWTQLNTEEGDWKIASDGILLGTYRKGTNRWLITEKSDWNDFHFRCETMQAEGMTSGILVRFRQSPRGGVQGLGIALFGLRETHAPFRVPTGTQFVSFRDLKATVTVPAQQASPKEGDWFRLEAIVQGASVVVKINGQEVSRDENCPGLHPSGAVAILQRSETMLRFRKIEIKELKTD